MNIERAQVMDYDELTAELEAMHILKEASEVHGLVCGQLGAGLDLPAQSWLASFLIELDVHEVPDEVAQEVLKALYQYTLEDLDSPELGFYPLLPDDDTPIAQRVSGLGLWCTGFLAGFGLAWRCELGDLPDELVRALKDLAAISEVDVEELGSDEESESELFSVIEYVRMVVMMVYTECALKYKSSDALLSDKPTLH